MISVPHSLNFVTEFDENHPVAQRFLMLDELSRVRLLESMLKDLMVPVLLPEINKINENGSYAILKVVTK
jgi:hypothetical protein